MHSIGPELPISAHVASACVCRQLYVLRASHALVQATVGVGTVIIVYIGVAYTKGGGVSFGGLVPERCNVWQQMGETLFRASSIIWTISSLADHITPSPP